MNQHHAIRRLCVGAVIAALYAALTLALPMLSYGPIQLRFGEALTVLPFFFPEAVPGLFVGCILANLASPYLLDAVFGSLATLIAALWTARLHSRALAPLPPVLCNAAIVGLEIALATGGSASAVAASWAWNALTVGAGELIACYGLGIPLMRFLPRIGALRAFIPDSRLPYARAAGNG